MVAMKSKVVAILETRTGAHLAELISRRGGLPLLAPALEEVPDIEPAAVRSLVEPCHGCREIGVPPVAHNPEGR